MLKSSLSDQLGRVHPKKATHATRDQPWSSEAFPPEAHLPFFLMHTTDLWCRTPHHLGAALNLPRTSDGTQSRLLCRTRLLSFAATTCTSLARPKHQAPPWRDVGHRRAQSLVGIGV
jgi:hypothetical protein